MYIGNLYVDVHGKLVIFKLTIQHRNNYTHNKQIQHKTFGNIV
jgi:hypothetical protein